MRAQPVHASGEHDNEPVPGLPARLPAGEHILWQGAPQWRVLAVQAFHVRKVALYFGLMLLWRALSVWADSGAPLAVAAALALPLALAASGLGLLNLLAWLSARTTAYTLTNRRVVMRVGIVLSVSFNLPLSRLQAAALQPHSGGHGSIALQLSGASRIAYLHLWPHARPWHLARPEPMLRAVAQAELLARLLTDALGNSARLPQLDQPLPQQRPQLRAA